MVFDPSQDIVVPDARYQARGISLHFMPITDARNGESPHWVTLLAFVYVTPVGYLSWNTADGEADLVWVEPPLRRRGVATALWRHAHELATERNWTLPRQSNDRSAEGNAWASSVETDEDFSQSVGHPPWNSDAMAGQYYYWRHQRWLGFGWAQENERDEEQGQRLSGA